VFLILWAGYKIKYKTRVITPERVDLVTGIQAIDDEEEQYLQDEKAKGPVSFGRKLWDSL
jgi:yeast amino acid transporter